MSENATSLDDLVSGAARDADKAATAVSSTKPAAKAEEASEDKKGKKDKDKNMKLVYSDNEVSPEEKMAYLPGTHSLLKERLVHRGGTTTTVIGL